MKKTLSNVFLTIALSTMANTSAFAQQPGDNADILGDNSPESIEEMLDPAKKRKISVKDQNRLDIGVRSALQSYMAAGFSEEDAKSKVADTLKDNGCKANDLDNISRDEIIFSGTNEFFVNGVAMRIPSQQETNVLENQDIEECVMTSITTAGGIRLDDGVRLPGETGDISNRQIVTSSEEAAKLRMRGYGNNLVCLAPREERSSGRWTNIDDDCSDLQVAAENKETLRQVITAEVCAAAEPDPDNIGGLILKGIRESVKNKKVREWVTKTIAVVELQDLPFMEWLNSDAQLQNSAAIENDLRDMIAAKREYIEASKAEQEHAINAQRIMTESFPNWGEQRRQDFKLSSMIKAHYIKQKKSNAAKYIKSKGAELPQVPPPDTTPSTQTPEDSSGQTDRTPEATPLTEVNQPEEDEEFLAIERPDGITTAKGCYDTEPGKGIWLEIDRLTDEAHDIAKRDHNICLSENGQFTPQELITPGRTNPEFIKPPPRRCNISGVLMDLEQQSPFNPGPANDGLMKKFDAINQMQKDREEEKRNEEIARAPIECHGAAMQHRGYQTVEQCEEAEARNRERFVTDLLGNNFRAFSNSDNDSQTITCPENISTEQCNALQNYQNGQTRGLGGVLGDPNMIQGVQQPNTGNGDMPGYIPQ